MPPRKQTAASEFAVEPFSKGGFAVYRNGELITRTLTKEQAEEFVERLQKEA